MAGGIFVENPWHPNPKCIVFALLMITAYWFAPSKNLFMLPLIFVIAYVLLAWYDFIYDCNQVMLSGSLIGPNTFDAIFKPQRRDEIINNTTYEPDQEKAYLSRVYLFHVLAVAPLLMYIGYKGKNADSRSFPILFTMGLLAMIYHLTRVFYPRQTN